MFGLLRYIVNKDKIYTQINTETGFAIDQSWPSHLKLNVDVWCFLLS